MLIRHSAERAQLDSLVAGQTTTTAPGPIHILGDTGVGKSRLAGYLEPCLTSAGIASLHMNADSLRRTTGFYPWHQLVEALLGPYPHLGDPTAVLADAPAMADHIPLLSPVLHTPIPDTEFTAQLFGGGRAEKTQAAIIALLEHLIGPAAHALIVENARRLDSTSRQPLDSFSRAFAQYPLCWCRGR